MLLLKNYRDNASAHFGTAVLFTQSDEMPLKIVARTPISVYYIYMHNTFLICLLHASLLLIIGCGSDSDSGNSAPPPVNEEGSDAATDEGVDEVNDLIDDLANAPGNTSANLAAAHSSFQEAVALNPNNGTARMFLAMTTMSSFFEEGQSSITQSTLGGLLDDFGFGLMNRSLSDLASGLSPTTPAENFDSSTPNLGRVQDWLADEVFLQLFDAVADHLEAVPAEFRDTITLNGVDIEIDCADARMIAAQFRLYQVAVLTFLAFDFDMNLEAVNDLTLVWVDGEYSAYAPYRLSSDWSSGTDGFHRYWDKWWGDATDHVHGLNPRTSLIGTASAGASNFLETTQTDRMNLARVRLQKALNNTLIAGPLLLSETASQRSDGLISISDNQSDILSANALLDWITPMPSALNSSVPVVVPDVYDTFNGVHYPSIELSRPMLASQTYSGRPFLPNHNFTQGEYGLPVATAASFDFVTLGSVWTELTGQDLLEVFSDLSIAFESSMIGASQVRNSWNEKKVIGNWQYSYGVYPQYNYFRDEYYWNW